MTEEPLITVSNLDMFIDKNHILKNINLSIPKNKITVILGPSGCGKTSLLKCFNRLTDLYPEIKVTGEINIENENILQKNTDVNLLRMKMGLLSQRPYPMPMSIKENIVFALKLKGITKKTEQMLALEELLRQVNLWDEVKDRLHEPAAKLSVGQQQRLCLARGLAVKPSIILADEPTASLDPLSNRIIEGKFIELKSNYTIVLVTHILRQARRLADNVIFIYMGEVVEQGNAKDFFENPKMERTQSYLSGMFN